MWEIKARIRCKAKELRVFEWEIEVRCLRACLKFRGVDWKEWKGSWYKEKIGGVVID